MRALVINPRRDTDFASKAEAEGAAAATPEALQAVLRTEYPRTVVRPRVLEGESAEVWYVYRDGTWVSE